MKIEYTNRAIADLRKVSADSRARFGAAVAAALEKRIRNVVDHVAAHPEAAPKVTERPGVRVFPLIRYPYKIFLSRSQGPCADIAHPAYVSPALGDRRLIEQNLG